jgi:hypothetical protein
MGPVLAVTVVVMRQTRILLVLTLAACTDSVPCLNCPPIDGVYAVDWGDGGIDTSDAGAGCPFTGPRDSTWTLTQSAARVTAVVAGTTLGGTLYDSYDLVLSGSADSASYNLHALTIPEGTGPDAGVELKGTFTTHTVPTTGEPCALSEAFTAQRTSR